MGEVVSVSQATNEITEENTENTGKKGIVVFFRVCDKVETLHLPRPFNLDKKTIIKICFSSLLNSLNENDRIVIIGDDCSKEIIDFLINKSLKNNRNITNIINEKMGAEKSMAKAFELASAEEDDTIVYFCEDDYLHFPMACDEMKIAVNIGFVVHPTDYPDQYKAGRIFPTFLMLGRRVYFRTINTTTFTFMCKAKFIKSNYEFLKGIGVDDAKLSNLFGWEQYDKETQLMPSSPNGKLLSPIPSLACHLHTDTLPPFINWGRLIEDGKQEI